MEYGEEPCDLEDNAASRSLWNTTSVHPRCELPSRNCTVPDETVFTPTVRVVWNAEWETPREIREELLLASQGDATRPLAGETEDEPVIEDDHVAVPPLRVQGALRPRKPGEFPVWASPKCRFDR